jgi:hypothetical protein
MDFKRKLISGTVDTDKMVFAAAPGVNINQGHSLIVDDYEQVLYDYLRRDCLLFVKDMDRPGSFYRINCKT